MTGKLVTVDELIESEFDDNLRFNMTEIIKYDVICLRLGFEKLTKLNGYVIEKLWDKRRARGLFTFFTSREPLEKFRGLYGINLYKLFKNDVQEYIMDD